MATTHTSRPVVVPESGSYALDTSHSHVNFTARHLMVTKVRGTFPVAEGALVIGEDPEQSSVEATIDVRQLHSGDPKREEHLRSADFFDTENYPTAHFRSTKVEDLGDGEFKLHGELTIRDVTHPVTLNGQFLGSQVSPWGDTRIGFSAETEVNRRDWGLEWNMALEAGGVVVSEKAKLEIDAEWIKQ
jgi:polyisoprenoid-binding protein YceI